MNRGPGPARIPTHQELQHQKYEQPIENSRCTEVCGMVPNLVATDGITFSSGLVVVSNDKCRVAEISVNLDNEAAAGDYFIFVWDVKANVTVAELQSTTNKLPLKLPPKKINPGETRRWVGHTKWTLFDTGIVLAISSTDSSYTDAGDAFRVFRHLIYNYDGRS